MSFFKILLFGCFFVVLSCMYYPPNGNFNKNNPPPPAYDSTPPPIERETVKKPSPTKQKTCQKRSRGNCEGDRDCEEVCDDIFSSRSRRDCYKLAPAMVFEFENLISATEDGDIDEISNIGPDILECMLDIDERRFAKAVRDMSRREAEEFFAFIVSDEDFSEVLEDEDDEFNVLEQIFHELGARNLTDILSKEIDYDGDDETVILLAGGYNEDLWKYLDGYVDEICDKGDSQECPGGENIGAYCKALEEAYSRERDWENFLSSADIFADEYENEVDDEDYEYEITDRHGSDYNGDFRDYCAMKIASSSSSGGGGSPPGPISANNGCPSGADRDQSTQTFGAFTFSTVLRQKNYIHDSYRDSDGSDLDNQGSSNPSSQDNILFLGLVQDDPGYRFDSLTMKQPFVFNGQLTYYFYLADQRVEVFSRDSNTFFWDQNGITHRIFTIEINTNGPLYTNIDGASAWMAIETVDGRCIPYE